MIGAMRAPRLMPRRLRTNVPKHMALELLAPCPPFDLPGTDDKNHSLADVKGKLFVLLVSCNHCPYVIAYEPRMVALANEGDSPHRPNGGSRGVSVCGTLLG